MSSKQEPAEKAEKGKKEEKAEKGKKGEKEGRPSVSLGGYRPFFRELDMEVLSVLQCGLLPRKAPDTELNTKVPPLTLTLTLTLTLRLTLTLTLHTKVPQLTLTLTLTLTSTPIYHS